MKILHGTWIPHSGDEFIQGGNFYLWVETDTPSTQKQQSSANSHPQHLTRQNLATFLVKELGIPALTSGGSIEKLQLDILSSLVPRTNRYPPVN